MIKYWFWVLIINILFLISCKESGKENISHLVKEWSGRKVVLSDNMIFTMMGKDTVDLLFHQPYTIMTYADSIGCISCKLQLANWKTLISELEAIVPDKVQFLFLLNPKDTKELQRLLLREKFDYPICIDKNDIINRLNQFPKEVAFQTFLLDSDNRVVAIGNPVHNPKVKELYLNIIQGKTSTKEENSILTKIQVKENTISLGRFNWQEEQKAQFTIYNVGNRPLVINDVTTSCGCTSVDYSKQPVSPDDSISLQVNYKADHPEHFGKTITVYCNTNPSLIQLKITGDAE